MAKESGNDRVAFLEEAVAELSQQVKGLLQQNELLAKQVQTPVSRREADTLRLQQRQEQRQKELERRIAALEDGPKKFNVHLAKEPRWGRDVGAASADEAKMKFMQFAGIRGTSQENPVVAEERETAAA